MSDLKDKLGQLESAFQELEEQLAQPEVFGDQPEYRKMLKRRAELERIVRKYHELQRAESDRAGAQSLLRDPDEEVLEMAREELADADKRIAQLEQELRLLLLPPDPNDEKNIIVEIRAGTGGEEAALFVADLLRMYVRYAEVQGWKIELLGANKTGLGGFREVSFSVSGESVYSHLKFEGGVHRVQRIPETEASGRIHTSAVTVAVLPEAEAVDVKLKSEDLRIDVYRSSGPGGQSVNTTDSAVRITHLPSNTVVSIQDEKSQHKNREKAMKVLRARIYEAEQRKQNEEISASKRAMIGSGDRSERIRTYNFPQNRVTDHRIGLSLYKLDRVMEGELDELINALRLHARTERLKLAEAL